MKKILEMFGEPITYGGQESVVYNMLSSLDIKNDYKVDLFTPYYADNKNLIDLIKNNNGEIHFFNIKFKTNDNRFKLEKYVKKFFTLHHDYDIVHIHSGSLTTMVVYAKIAKEFNIKKIIVHSHIINKGQGLLFKMRRLILNALLKNNVDVYIGCTEGALKSKFIFNKKDNSYIIYNGIDIDKFKFNQNYRDEIRTKYNINNKYVIGSLGRISKQKNCKFIIDIIKKIHDDNVVLLMVGDGEELVSIKKYVSENNLQNKVIFAGNQIETHKYLCAFDVFLMPSLYEGFPVTSIEAQVAGLPCALSDLIPKEVKISDNTSFLSLKSIDDWILYINKYHNFERNNNIDINFEKYDRCTTFSILKKIYK